MKIFRSTVSSKGQTTVPIELRRMLGMEEGGRLEFVLDANGDVTLVRPEFDSLDSIVGFAGTLPRPMSWEEQLEIALEDAHGVNHDAVSSG